MMTRSSRPSGTGDAPPAPARADADPVDGALAGPGSYLWPWTRQEIRLLFREPVAVFFSLAFPLIIYAFIGSAYAEDEIEPGIRLIDVMFPGLVATVAANLTLMGMPVYFGEIRSRGVLKRYRSLPMPGWVFGVAVVGSLVVLFALSAAILVVVVGTTHRLQPGLVSPTFIGLLVVLLAWVSAFGFFLGCLPVKTRTIQTVSAAAFFVAFFGSGMAAPLDGLPGWLELLTRANPLRHWFDGLIDAYLGEPLDGRLLARMAAVLPVAALAVVAGLHFLRREADA